MKIENNTNVSCFQFKHNGKHLNFRCTHPTKFSDFQQTEPSSMVEFEFDDVLEIRELIRMLECFEGLCKKSFGTWEIK